MDKKLYIYYSEGTNNHGGDDVAIVPAINVDNAVSHLKAFYNNACSDNVKLIDCNINGVSKPDFVKNIMIVSKY